LGPRLQAQPRRAPSSATRRRSGSRRFAGADRGGYESGARGGHRPLQWWGLYQTNPRSHVHAAREAAGRIRGAEKLRAIGEVSESLRRGVGELATRQNVQLHHLSLRPARRVRQLDAAGITTAGGCGDTVRNITGSPVQGIDPWSCSTAPRSSRSGRLLLRQPRLLELPRKHKYSIAATPDRDNAPEITAIALVARSMRGRGLRRARRRGL